jgi:hypothetical protein
MIDDTPLRVALFGMSKQASAQLEILFRDFAHSRFSINSEKEAEAAIIDLDGFGAMELWHKLRSQHTWPMLLLSLYARDCDTAFFVQKPIDTSTLLATLEKLKTQVREHQSTAHKNIPDKRHLSHTMTRASAVYEDASLCHQVKEINLNDTKARQQIYYVPDEYLQGILQQAWHSAKRENSSVRLDGFKYPLLINLERRQILYAVPENEIHSFAIMPVNKSRIKIVPISTLELQQRIQNPVVPFRYENFEAFLWRITVWSAHGRLPEHTDLDVPIALLYWPNFTRLLLTPHALQIAALWRKRPYSLRETLNILQISQCAVFGFYSAAYTLGQALPDPQYCRQFTSSTPAPAAASNPVATTARSLLQRLLGHLQKGKNT